MSRVDIAIPEGDQPLFTFTAVVRDQVGVDTPIDLTGASVSWISKLNATVADGSGITIVGTPQVPLVDGVFTVQITSAVTASAGEYVYKVIVNKNSRPLTVQYGDLFVENT